MPRHNRPDLAEGLRRKYATDPPGAFDTISPEIVPVEIVGVLETEPRAGLRGCAADCSLGAIAANNNTLALVNPADSGVIAQIYEVGGSSTSGDYYRCSINSAISATITGLTLLDATFITQAQRGYPSCQAYGGAQAGGTVFGRSIRNIHANAAVPVRYEFDPPVELNPGSQFAMVLLTVNTSLYGYLGWLERPLSIDVP